MIPHTPMLLVSAVHALARLAPRMRRQRPDLPCSLEFVQAVGWTTHVDPMLGASSWPLAHVTSLAMLEAVAWRRDQLRARARVGDILIFPEEAPSEVNDLRDGRPLDDAAGAEVVHHPGASGERGESWRAGVVLKVFKPRLETTGSIRRCLVATARATEDPATMEVVVLLHWCDTRWRDTVVRWYDTPSDIERAA